MPLKLNSDRVNYLNMGLMALSAVLAYAHPFELFLSVYAVLGPLHYLTEISWLHDRNYYTRGRYDYWVLLGTSVLITGCYLGGLAGGAFAGLTCFAFVAAFFFAFFEKPSARFLGAGAAALVAFLFAGSAVVGPFFGLLMPTLIHVFVFTAFFILAGALRGKSLSGVLSLAVFAAIGGSFLFFHPAHAGYQVSDYVRNNYGTFQGDGQASNPFIGVNYFVAKSLGLQGFAPGSLAASVEAINAFLYRNPAALALMSFIAFAYTYHYLNWFSKTSVIRWHEVPRGRLAAVVLVWLASLGIYAYDYSAGIKWLFFLSFTHVLLEFPLNHLTAVGLLKGLWNRLVPVSKQG